MALAHLARRSDESERHHRLEQQLQGYASQGTRVELHYPSESLASSVYEALGRKNILNGLPHLLQAGAITHKVAWASENGFEAVVQTNTFDPGVEAGRLAVTIPVIGPLRASLHLASVLCDRVGIFVPLEAHIPHTRRLVRAYGMESIVVDIKALNMYGRVHELRARRDEMMAVVYETIVGLIGDSGAESIVPLGGALVPEVLDPSALQDRAGVPVVNTIAAAIQVAEACVALGLSHSEAAYPPAGLPSTVYEG